MLVRISIEHSQNGLTFLYNLLGKFVNSYHGVAIAMKNAMQVVKKSGRVEIWRELN